MVQTQRGALKFKRSVEDALFLSAVRFCFLLSRILPLAFAVRLAAFVGKAYSYLAPRRRLAYRNLWMCFGAQKTPGERTRILRDNFAHLAMNFMELFYLNRMDKAFIRSHIRIEGDGPIMRYADGGRGVVILTAHFGNWELLNTVGSLIKKPPTVLVRDQRHPRAAEYLNRLRQAHGARIVSRGMGMREIFKVLEEGGLAGILADQDGGKRGIQVPLLGTPASFAPGVSRFAHAAEAVVIPVFDIREDATHHRIYCAAPIECSRSGSGRPGDKALITAFAEELEKMIKLHPEQWLWPYKRWKSTPHKRVLILSDGKKGHESQSIALARAYADGRDEAERSSIEIKVLTLRFRGSFHERLLWFYAFLTRGHMPGGWKPFLKALAPETRQALHAFCPDKVISCGASTEAANILIARKAMAQSAFIQKPQFGCRHFDAVVVPAYDRLKETSNLVSTQGPVLYTPVPERLESGRQLSRYLKDKGVPETPQGMRLALLLGGPSRRGVWHEVHFKELVSQTLEWARESSSQVILSTSRRTPEADERWAEDLSRKYPECVLFLSPKRPELPSHYRGVLEWADLFVVSSDSMMMLAEASQSGKPVLAVTVSEDPKPDAKLTRYLAGLTRTGKVQSVRPESVTARLRDLKPNRIGPASGGAPDSHTEDWVARTRRLLG